MVDGPFISNQIWQTTISANLLARSKIGPSYFNGEWLSWCPNSIANTFNGMTQVPPGPGWMLDLVAGTNPSRPLLTIPTLYQNMRELPSMIRDLGRQLNSSRGRSDPAGVASTYLGIKFGWLPLMQDLVQLVTLQQAILRRIEELYKLYYQTEGLRRRLQFGRTTTSTTTTGLWNLTSNAQGQTKVTVTETLKQWGTIKWKPTALPPFQPSDIDFAGLARKLVLGISFEGLAKGLWDVIPWTWLIGWFTNVGKYLMAHSNTVPAVHANGCYMSSVDRLVEVGATTYTGNPEFQRRTDPQGYAYFTRKTRVIGGAVSASAYVPFMGADRLSVMGALFAQRFLRR